MEDAARHLYDSLSSYYSIEALVDNAETEGSYIECKAAADPRLSPKQKAKLSKAISGFKGYILKDGGISR